MMKFAAAALLLLATPADARLASDLQEPRPPPSADGLPRVPHVFAVAVDGLDVSRLADDFQEGGLDADAAAEGLDADVPVAGAVAVPSPSLRGRVEVATTDADVIFTVAALGSSSCDLVGAELATLQECQGGAASMGLTQPGFGTSHSHVPKGCFCDPGLKRCWFNTQASSVNTDGGFLICKAATTLAEGIAQAVTASLTTETYMAAITQASALATVSFSYFGGSGKCEDSRGNTYPGVEHNYGVGVDAGWCMATCRATGNFEDVVGFEMVKGVTNDYCRCLFDSNAIATQYSPSIYGGRRPDIGTGRVIDIDIGGMHELWSRYRCYKKDLP